MADFDVSTMNVKKGRIEVEGRIFQIEFWNDGHFKLPWVSVAEIVSKEVKPHWFSRKTELREVEKPIDSGWLDGNRIEWATKRIERYLQNERDDIEEQRQIEEFCCKNDC